MYSASSGAALLGRIVGHDSPAEPAPQSRTRRRRAWIRSRGGVFAGFGEVTEIEGGDENAEEVALHQR
jgi:hypothetical protein